MWPKLHKYDRMEVSDRVKVVVVATAGSCALVHCVPMVDDGVMIAIVIGKYRKTFKANRLRL